MEWSQSGHKNHQPSHPSQRKILSCLSNLPCDRQIALAVAELALWWTPPTWHAGSPKTNWHIFSNIIWFSSTTVEDQLDLFVSEDRTEQRCTSSRLLLCFYSDTKLFFFSWMNKLNVNFSQCDNYLCLCAQIMSISTFHFISFQKRRLSYCKATVDDQAYVLYEDIKYYQVKMDISHLMPVFVPHTHNTTSDDMLPF